MSYPSAHEANRNSLQAVCSTPMVRAALGQKRQNNMLARYLLLLPKADMHFYRAHLAGNSHALLAIASELALST